MFRGFGGGGNNGSPRKGQDDKETSLSSLARGGDSSQEGKMKKESVTGFDPEGLERAAKAARDLDQSRNSSAAIDLIKTQEVTKQHEAAAKRAEMNAYMEQLKAQNIEKEGDEARKTLNAQTQHEQERARYKDELERKRQVDMLDAQRYMQEQLLKKQEDMVARQEAQRRKTAEHEAELQKRTEVARAQAEAEGRIRQERENFDLMLERLRLEAAERRATFLQTVSQGGQMLGQGVASFLTDTTQLRNTALTLTAVAAGVYGARTSIGIAGRYIEARLGKPSLVRETSRRSLWLQPWSWMQRLLRPQKSEDALQGIVLEPALDKQLRQIAISTAHTKRNRAPFRHLLLHGPPGTGKTMFAKGLAQHSGLDFAIFTGGDVAPLGRDAVTELHKLFDWAKTSSRGLLLFVDEADAFLQSRALSAMTKSEDARNALNAFLFRTGTESDHFMMVYASNEPSQFDKAILDRVDEMVEFGLPGPDERRAMLALYMEKYLLNPPGHWSKRVELLDDIGEAELQEAVHLTEGFSGRAMAKLAIAWQAAAYGTAGAVLEREVFFQTIRNFQKNWILKDQWLTTTTSKAEEFTTDL